MKKTFAALAIALSFALAACGTVPSSTGGSATPGPVVIDTGATIAQIQAAAKAACAFVPTASTVASILSAVGVPYIGMASDLANQICGALASVKGARGAVATVKGVRIRGSYVR